MTYVPLTFHLLVTLSDTDATYLCTLAAHLHLSPESVASVFLSNALKRHQELLPVLSLTHSAADACIGDASLPRKTTK